MSGDRDHGETAPAEQRWWVDTGEARPTRPAEEKPPALVGARFFDIGYDFEQERAKSRLTDVNLKFLEETRPEPGRWRVVRMVPGEAIAESRIQTLKQHVPLPEGARGLIVDSGRSARLILTGEPVGERILEFRIGESASFDCWIRGEWVREELFRDEEHALRDAGAFVNRYLGSTELEAF